MRFPARRRWIFAVALLAAMCVALGLFLVIRFLVPLTLEVADRWASVLAMLLTFILALTSFLVWFARSTRPVDAAIAETVDVVPLLERLRQASLVRTRDGWVGLGVSAEAASRLERAEFEAAFDLELPSRGAVLVTGDLGAGKSFIAESLYRRRIDQVIETGVGPWPCLLFARDLEAADLATMITSTGPPAWSSGYQVLLDGCDEVSRDEAARIYREARVFAGLHQDSPIVLLARPGYVSAAEEIAIPQMSETAIERLMSAVAGYDVTMNHISQEMQDAVRLPLFAILYARQGFRQLRSMTTAGLLAAMVEEVLHRDRATSDHLSSMLRSLALRTTTHRGRLPLAEAGGLAQREKLLGTRLVVSRDAAIRFAAPVLEQYFTAQALLLGELDITDQLASLREWEMWRPAWVMAVATGGWDDTSRLVAALAAHHTGAAAWLVRHAVRDPSHLERADTDPLDFRAVEQRLQRALDTWCAAVPDATSMATKQLGALRLIVREYDKGGLFLGIWADRETPPTEKQIREGMALFKRADGWWGRGTIRLGNVPAWPWLTALSLVAQMVSVAVKTLAKDADAPSLHDEQVWATVRHMAPSHLRHHLSGQRDRSTVRAAILASVDGHIRRFEQDQPVRYRVDGREFRLDDLVALKEHMLATPAENLADPWPGPNHPLASGDRSGYDLDHLAARTAAIYSAAFDAYAHIVRTRLSQLADTLELAILMPVKMKAYVDADRDIPGIHFELWPQPSGEANQLSIVPGTAPPQIWDKMKETYRRFARDLERCRPESAAWVRSFGADMVLEVFGDRPATKLAFGWLWHDLRAIGMVEDMSPAFDF